MDKIIPGPVKRATLDRAFEQARIYARVVDGSLITRRRGMSPRPNLVREMVYCYEGERHIATYFEVSHASGGGVQRRIARSLRYPGGTSVYCNRP